MAEARREALRIANLMVRFQTPQGQVNALNGVSLVQEEGQVYCLVGESGSGKSTLALTIMGLLPNNATIERGAIYFDGVNLLSSGPDHMRTLRGKEIAMVFQDAQSALNPVQLVGDQIEEIILEHADVSARIANRMAQEMLRQTGLAEPCHTWASTFSPQRGYVPASHDGHGAGLGASVVDCRRAHLGSGRHPTGRDRFAPQVVPRARRVNPADYP